MLACVSEALSFTYNQLFSHVSLQSAEEPPSYVLSSHYNDHPQTFAGISTDICARTGSNSVWLGEIKENSVGNFCPRLVVSPAVKDFSPGKKVRVTAGRLRCEYDHPLNEGRIKGNTTLLIVKRAVAIHLRGPLARSRADIVMTALCEFLIAAHGDEHMSTWRV